MEDAEERARVTAADPRDSTSTAVETGSGPPPPSSTRGAPPPPSSTRGAPPSPRVTAADPRGSASTAVETGGAPLPPSSTRGAPPPPSSTRGAPPPPSSTRGVMPQHMAQGQATAGKRLRVCAVCGHASKKKCAGCLVTRYCSEECQHNDWNSHKVKCHQLKLADPVDKHKLPCEGKSNSSKSSGMDSTSVVANIHISNKNYNGPLVLDNLKCHNSMPCGLVNFGKNSCFVNVILQCLCCTKPLVDFLLRNQGTLKSYLRKEHQCFSYDLLCHMQRASKSTEAFEPTNILSHLPNIGGSLKPGKQEDADEFLRLAINKLQSECRVEDDGDRSQDETNIKQIFGGRVRSQVYCTECSKKSDKYDDIMDLQVEIGGGAQSLEQCLKQYTTKEWLDGVNMYKCSVCCKYVKAWKRLTVHEAPNVLIISLKRFEHRSFGKLNNIVTFPLMLNILPYMSTSEGNNKYDLYAIVVHLDFMNKASSGHYICFIKNCQGQWFKVDDSKVISVDEQEVLSQHAYLLLYSRRNVEGGCT